LTEICIGLQDLALPAWVTVQILDAARPWSTLPLHSKWNLVCAVKHYHDKKQQLKQFGKRCVVGVLLVAIVDESVQCVLLNDDVDAIVRRARWKLSALAFR
jgi:hypothetical protein